MIKNIFITAFLVLAGRQAAAEDIVTQKTISMELARDIASKAVQVCREKGYQVSAVVVDSGNNLRVALRDDLASRFTLQISEQKANAAIMAGLPSGEFRDRRGDIRPEMNHVDGVLMMQGGIEILAGGYRLGAIGVSGAPGGDIDESCAVSALKAFEERLEFAIE